MSSSPRSARAFALYLFFVGAMLMVAPNPLLSVFRIPPTTDVWIRLVGVLVFNIGVFAWVCATDRRFLTATVYTRCGFCAAVTVFAALGLASPMLVLFGLIDLLGALWTFLALRAEARAGIRP